MSKNKNVVDDFSNFVDKHLRVIRFCVLGIAVTGGVVLMRNLHLFRRFRDVHEIPKRYIEKSIKLRGLVKDVRDGSTLMVEHVPIIDLPWSSKSDGTHIPVKLAGVKANMNGQSWLEVNLLNSEIKFAPLLVHKGEIHAKVRFIRRRILRTKVNEELIKTGVSTVTGFDVDKITEDKTACEIKDNLRNRIRQQQYYWLFIDKLLALEINAEKKKIGLWQDEQSL